MEKSNKREAILFAYFHHLPEGFFFDLKTKEEVYR